MAIQPDLSLQVNPPVNPLAMVGQFAQTASALQSIQNAKAALPGIQADSAIKQRAAASNKWITDNASKYTYQATDSATGEPIKNLDGSPKLVTDTPKLVQDMGAAGFVPEAQGITANYLTNKGQELLNQNTAASTAQTQAQTNNLTLAGQDAKIKLAVDARTLTALNMDAFAKAKGIDLSKPLSPADQTTLDNENTRNISLYQATAGAKGSLNAIGVFGYPVIGPSGPPGPNGESPVLPNGAPDVGKYKFDPATNAEFMQSGMSAEVRANMEATQRGPDWDNPNGAVTKAMQNTAMSVATSDQQKQDFGKLTATQLYANPFVKATWDLQQNPVNAKTQANANAAGYQSQADAFHNAANAWDAYKKTLSPQDQAAIASGTSGSIGAWIASHKAMAMGGPQRDALMNAEQMLNNAKAADSTQKLDAMDAGSVSTIMNNLGDYNHVMGLRQFGIANSPTISGAAKAAVTPGPAAAGNPGNRTPGGAGGSTTSTAQVPQAKQPTMAEIQDYATRHKMTVQQVQQALLAKQKGAAQ